MKIAEIKQNKEHTQFTNVLTDNVVLNYICELCNHQTNNGKIKFFVDDITLAVVIKYIPTYYQNDNYYYTLIEKIMYKYFNVIQNEDKYYDYITIEEMKNFSKILSRINKINKIKKL